MTVRGVSLQTSSHPISRKHHVHNETDDWEITSGHRVDEIATVDIVERMLPGRLGSFIYPSDAVFTLKKSANTLPHHLEEIVARERSKRNGINRINHISVEIDVDQRQSEDEDMSGDDDEDEDPDEENDVDGQEQWCEDDEDIDAD